MNSIASLKIKNNSIIVCDTLSNHIVIYKILKMAGVLKKTTGLTGLAVAPSPYHTLGIIYSKILRTLQKMPDTAAYRKHTEKVVVERAAVLKSTPNIYDVESKVGCGQIEELIVQAENELTLARKMLGWKAWEPLIGKPPQGQWNWPPQ